MLLLYFFFSSFLAGMITPLFDDDEFPYPAGNLNRPFGGGEVIFRLSMDEQVLLAEQPARYRTELDAHAADIDAVDLADGARDVPVHDSNRAWYQYFLTIVLIKLECGASQCPSNFHSSANDFFSHLFPLPSSLTPTIFTTRRAEVAEGSGKGDHLPPQPAPLHRGGSPGDGPPAEVCLPVHAHSALPRQRDGGQMARQVHEARELD